MSERGYNLMSKEAFENLTKADPKFILNYMMDFAESSRQYPSNTLLVPYTHIPREPPAGRYVREFGCVFTDFPNTRKLKLLDWETMHARMISRIVGLKALSFRGYVMAGSAVVVFAGDSPSFSPADADFYPVYDVKAGKAQGLSVQEQATSSFSNFLNDLQVLFDTHEKDVKNGGPRPDGENKYDIERNVYRHKWDVKCRRNKYCATVVVGQWRIESRQFVFRAHPSAASVVAGFDLMACKAFYDGEMAYFTVDAALCLYFGINPVDWRRESPSHLSRVLKYLNYGFSPIFPGLSFDVYDKMTGYEKDLDRGSLGEYTINKGYIGFIVNKIRKWDRTLADCRLFVRNREHPFYRVVPDHPINPEDGYVKDYADGNVRVEDSDYDADTAGIVQSIYDPFEYLSVAGLVKGDLRKIHVFADRPVDLLHRDKTRSTDIRHILRKCQGGSFTRFYFPEMGDRILEIQTELSRLLVAQNPNHQIRHRLLSDADRLREQDLRAELEEIVDARIIELEEREQFLCDTQDLYKIVFEVSNPGGQFTGSFQPIVRSSPKESFGSLCMWDRKPAFYYAKLEILKIRKFGRTRGCPYFAVLPLDLIKIIFEYLYDAHYRDFAVTTQSYPINLELSECEHKKLPWCDGYDCKCTKIELYAIEGVSGEDKLNRNN
jgi:hypothetical protein